MNRTLILTGCAGFIGINFIKHIIDVVYSSYDKVISIDKLGYATKYNLRLYKKICKDNNIITIDYDINSTPFIGDFEDNMVDVVNFASESHVDNSIDSPEKIFEENSMLVVNLLKIIPKEKINKFIQISTDEVYGDLSIGTEYDDWFKIGDEFKPSNPYSASKVAQDAYLMSMRHTFGLNVQFIRMANQFGPHQHPEKMLPASILRAASGNPIKIYGTGENIRQWTPVVYTVKIIYQQLFNISLDDLFIAKKYVPVLNNNSIVDLWIKELKRIDNKRFNNIEKEYIQDRKGHDMMYALQTDDYVDSFYTNYLDSDFNETICHYIENSDLYKG